MSKVEEEDMDKNNKEVNHIGVYDNIVGQVSGSESCTRSFKILVYNPFINIQNTTEFFRITAAHHQNYYSP